MGGGPRYKESSCEDRRPPARRTGRRPRRLGPHLPHRGGDPTMTATVIRGDARRLPLADGSVDLVCTSPPYFSLRSYTDGGEHYAGQVGSEPTPGEFLAALWEVTAECVRVLKPGGSIFVNLGDKYAGSGGHNNAGISERSTLSGNGHTGGVGKAGPQKIKATRRSSPDRYNQASDGIRPKSLMGLPWRYAIGCVDCVNCSTSWRGGAPCFVCDQPGQPGHKGSEPAGWPRVTVTPGAVLPGRREA